jgi:hypothetical protein
VLRTRRPDRKSNSGVYLKYYTTRWHPSGALIHILRNAAMPVCLSVCLSVSARAVANLFLTPPPPPPSPEEGSRHERAPA